MEKTVLSLNLEGALVPSLGSQGLGALASIRSQDPEVPIDSPAGWTQSVSALGKERGTLVDLGVRRPLTA